MNRMTDGEMLAQLHEAEAMPSGLSSKDNLFCFASEEIFFCEFDQWRKFQVWVWSVKKESEKKWLKQFD